MVPINSLDEVLNLVIALLQDISTMHGAVFDTAASRRTIRKLVNRVAFEGMSFLTKTLPKLGKALDRAMSTNVLLDCTTLGFKPRRRGSKLPMFMGELFSQVLDDSGKLLPNPCVKCVDSLRQLLYLLYKYELPYSRRLEQKVLDEFERTETELTDFKPLLAHWGRKLDSVVHERRRGLNQANDSVSILREARIALSVLFANFDPTDIKPQHGPGVVATKQKLWEKYMWSNVCSRITEVWPLDKFFYACLGHVCDAYRDFSRIGTEDLPAQVLLVPKDSRGPRLISCEPVDFQWVQQGLGRAIVRLVENHPLTKDSVFFHDQVPNRIGALIGSETGKYATLDLKEASDRVHLDLVRLLFPPHVFVALDAARSRSTVLPNGKRLYLQKFAPMGSALCFPIMALTVWSLLYAGIGDTYSRERIHVYGDDVIVPTAKAERAIELLEHFGLRVNSSKSCTTGLFRESCGMDAFLGVCVTPVRLRTVWSSTPSADAYVSWIEYANALFQHKIGIPGKPGIFENKRYVHASDYIASRLQSLYGQVPSKELFPHGEVPALVDVATNGVPLRRRWNRHLQKWQYYVRVVKAVSLNREISGWSMLLRFFAESQGRPSEMLNRLNEPKQQNHSELERCESALLDRTWVNNDPWMDYGMCLRNTDVPKPDYKGFLVRSYTRRRTSMLVRRWR
jgi:hypothetical protein